MSHHQYPTELHTVCDVVRWAMSEMERFDVTLGHGTADYWEEATFLVLRTLKLPFDRLEAFWNAHLTQDELWEVLKTSSLACTTRSPRRISCTKPGSPNTPSMLTSAC